MANHTNHAKAGRTAGSPNWKTAIRYEKIAYLTAAGVNDRDIAIQVGLQHPGSVVTIRRTPLYRSIFTRIATGVSSQLEESLGEDINYLKAKVKQALPQALDVLVTNLKNPDPKIRQSAAESLLDRDGHMSKVSRIGLPTEEQGGIGELRFDTTVADNLISLLNGKGVDNDIKGGSKESGPGSKLPA